MHCCIYTADHSLYFYIIKTYTTCLLLMAAIAPTFTYIALKTIHVYDVRNVVKLLCNLSQVVIKQM